MISCFSSKIVIIFLNIPLRGKARSIVCLFIILLARQVDGCFLQFLHNLLINMSMSQ